MSKPKRTGYAEGETAVKRPRKPQTCQRSGVTRGSTRVSGMCGPQLYDAEFLRTVAKFDSALLNFLGRQATFSVAKTATFV